MMFCVNCGQDMRAAEGTAGTQSTPSTANTQYTTPGGSSQPQPTYQTTYQAPPKRINATVYMVLAILATLFCCQALGIPAIIYAAYIDCRLTAGDLVGAEHCASRAKMFTIIAACLGVALVIFYCILYFGMIVPWLTAIAGSVAYYS